MSIPIVIRPRVQRALIELWTDVARTDPMSADRLLLSVDSELSLIALSPDLGRLREEFADGVRSFPEKENEYVMFYRRTPNGLELLAIIPQGADRSFVPVPLNQQVATLAKAEQGH